MADVDLKSKDPYEYLQVIAGLISENDICSGQQLSNETVRTNICLRIKLLRQRSLQIDKHAALLATCKTPMDRILQMDLKMDKTSVVQEIEELTHFLNTVFQSATTKEIYDRFLFGVCSQSGTSVKAYEAVMHHIKTMALNQVVQCEKASTSSPNAATGQPSQLSQANLSEIKLQESEVRDFDKNAALTPEPVINNSAADITSAEPGHEIPTLHKTHTRSKLGHTQPLEGNTDTIIETQPKGKGPHECSDKNAPPKCLPSLDELLPPDFPCNIQQSLPHPQSSQPHKENMSSDNNCDSVVPLSDDDDSEASRSLSGYDGDYVIPLSDDEDNEASHSLSGYDGDNTTSPLDSAETFKAVPDTGIERNSTDPQTPHVSGTKEITVKGKRSNRGSDYVDTTNIVTSKRRKITTKQESSAPAPTTPPVRKRRSKTSSGVKRSASAAVKSSQAASKAKRPRKKSNYPRFYCIDCKRTFFRSFKARHSVSKMHIRNVTKEKRVDVIEVLKTRDKCELCEKMFPIPSEYKAHFELCKKLDSKERVKQKVNLLQLAEQLQKEADTEKAGTMKELKSRLRETETQNK